MLRQLILIWCLLACAGAALAAEAGRVVFVAGHAQIANRPAVLEAAVQEGDELVTGADGYIYMKTVDSGFLILRPNSRARVAAYHIDQHNPANTHVKLELLSGVARSISGASVKEARQNFRFNTPVAAIGVRGTDFIVYTNQHTSWVSVVSGGVVVSAFAAGCGPEGSGPCEGSGSRELFAGRPDVLLQVQRGQSVPQLLHNTVIAPELNVPPRSDEPVGKVGTGGAAGVHGATVLNDISLDAAKSNVPVAASPVPMVPVAPPVVVVPEPELPVVPVAPSVKAPPEVLWGRWQSVAGVAPDPEVKARLNSGAYNKGVVVGSYVVARINNSSLVLPREGSVAFAMTDSEATLQKIGGQPLAAQVQNARLEIDFAARSFVTSLSVTNSLGQVNLTGKGDVTLQGGLESSLTSGATVRGYLGGAKADEAVYGFKSTGAPALSAAGVVRWSR